MTARTGESDQKRSITYLPAQRYRRGHLPRKRPQLHAEMHLPGFDQVLRQRSRQGEGRMVPCFLVGLNGGQDRPADGRHPSANGHTTYHAWNGKEFRIQATLG